MDIEQPEVYLNTMSKSTLLKILTYGAKAFGLVSTLNQIPFVKPEMGVIIFFAASLLKDTLNRVADFADDGVINQTNGQAGKPGGTGDGKQSG